MKLFYIAVGHDGKKVRGFIEAADSSKAAVYLREHELSPIRIEEQKKSYSFSSVRIFNRVNNKDIVFFTRQIASMLASGLTLSQALTILKNQTQKDSMIAVVDGIIINVEEGKSFSEAVSQYQQTFSPVYISLIKAGETTGVLDKVMGRLAETLEKRDKLRAQIRSALLYPIIVVILMVIVVGIMMVVVIPQLKTLYESLNIALPLPTQIIVDLSTFTVNNFVLIIVTSVGSLLYFNRWRKTEKGKFFVDSFLLKLPIFGKLMRESVMSEFSRTFGLLAATGSLVIESLNKSADVLGNSVYKKAVMQVADNVEKGVSIGDAMNANPLFPAILVEMVKIGEQTGKLDDSLMRVSEYFEREVEQTVKALTTAMEPIIMVGLAVGVGFLIIAVITPIYKLISSF